MEQTDRISYATNMAMKIFQELAEKKSCNVSPTRDEYEVFGNLNLSHSSVNTKVSANCVFTVRYDWLENIPAVRCNEKWITRGDPDWHISEESFICIDLNARWRDEIEAYSNRDFNSLINFASGWLLNSARAVLYRHLLKSRGIISRWDPSWDYWAHGEKGLKQYLELKK
ncbi:MAG: hypothetical protein WAX69_11730 [Victivallales bacterium]